MRNVVVILVALVIAVIGFFAVTTMMTEEEAPKEQPKQVVQEVTTVVEKEVPTSNIVVASSYIPIGTVLTERHFDIQPWPTHLKLPGFIDVDAPAEDGQAGGIDSVKRMITRTPFQKGEPIIMSKLSNPGDPSFLPSSLSRGMRAVTIPVNRISSVSGFIAPGDRIDVIITHNVDAGSESFERRNSSQRVSEILLSNVKILAVDQMAVSDANTQARIPNTVTLEVRAEDAQRVLLATKEGDLSLALRPLDEGDIEVARPTGVADLSRVTPPAYFPVIYDTSVSYVPEVVDLFGDVELDGISAAQKSLMLNAEDRSVGVNRGQPTSTQKSTGGPRHSVVVIRGVQREVIGVDRP